MALPQAEATTAVLKPACIVVKVFVWCGTARATDGRSGLMIKRCMVIAYCLLPAVSSIYSPADPTTSTSCFRTKEREKNECALSYLLLHWQSYVCFVTGSDRDAKPLRPQGRPIRCFGGAERRFISYSLFVIFALSNLPSRVIGPPFSANCL